MNIDVCRYAGILFGVRAHSIDVRIWLRRDKQKKNYYRNELFIYQPKIIKNCFIIFVRTLNENNGNMTDLRGLCDLLAK